MKTIIVDDERLLMEDLRSLCLQLEEIDEAEGFTRAADALEWLDDHEADIAFLDINMPDMNGIELAERIKKKSPDTAVIFVTGYAQYAVDAFAVRAAGYLMKPVTREMLQKDVAYVCSLKPDKKSQAHVFVRTFGNFDVFADGASVRFKMA